MYYVYMVKNNANKVYIGISQNPHRRLDEHNTSRGALFTSRIPCYSIVFLESYPTRSEARKREVQIKRWGRAKKDMLIERYANNLPTKLPA